VAKQRTRGEREGGGLFPISSYYPTIRNSFILLSQGERRRKRGGGGEEEEEFLLIFSFDNAFQPYIS